MSFLKPSYKSDFVLIFGRNRNVCFDFSVGSIISDAENEPHVLNASICKSHFSKTIVDPFYLGSLI